jgi:hypothetical protein
VQTLGGGTTENTHKIHPAQVFETIYAKKNAYTLQREAKKTQENGYVFVTQIASSAARCRSPCRRPSFAGTLRKLWASRKGVEDETTLVVDDAREQSQ